MDQPRASTAAEETAHGVHAPAGDVLAKRPALRFSLGDSLEHPELKARMRSLHEQLQNPLTRERDSQNRARLAVAFPVLKSCAESRFLALRCYLDSRPEKFFDKAAHDTYLAWLMATSKTRSQCLRRYLREAENEINRALFFLREINSERWHDRVLSNDEHELVRFVDKHIHPTYLRLTEAVLAPLSRPVAFFSRLARGKGTDGLDVWSIMRELETLPAHRYVTRYRHIIRNGIGHGGITFLQGAIKYRDKKGNEETVDNRSVVRLCDDLLDTCNGLAAGLKIFCLISREQGYVAPREWFVEELREETWAPWWKIESCVESEWTGKRQLVIYARPNTRHYSKVQWSTVQSGILAEFFAPGYDRYFLSLRSRQAWPGWAAFDGRKLRALREAGADDLSQFKGIIENDLIFYISRPTMPAILGKVDTFIRSIRLHAPIAMQQIKDKLKIPRIVCRSAAVHRNLWGAVLNASVIMEGLEDEAAVDIIHGHRRRIVRSAVKQARKAHRLSIAAYLPLAFAQVAVFKRDYRRRRLSGFGLGKELVCTVRFQRMRRIKSPNIHGSTVEISGKWRIAWNGAWLKTNG